MTCRDLPSFMHGATATGPVNLNALKWTSVHFGKFGDGTCEIMRLCQMLTLNLQYTGKKVNYLPDVRCKFADDA